MNIRLVWGVVATSILLGVTATATAASVEQTLEEQAETIRKLEQRVEELEAGPGREGTPPIEGPAAATHEPGAAPSPMEHAEAEQQVRHGREARVTFHDSFNDRQTAAARPSDYTLDPDFRGFIPIPRTALMIKFNARPRVDMTSTSGGPGSEYRFVPALFPVEGQQGYEGGWRVSGNANGSQLRMDIRAPSVRGDFRVYYQNDFFGDDQKPMRYRLQHLYAQAYGVLGGFTYGLFEDPDAWPDTIDYEAPNAVVFARRAVFHYSRMVQEDWEVTVGLENPEAYIDVTGDPNAVPRNRAPDGGFNVRWTPEGVVDHMQFSTLFRGLGIDGDTVPDQSIFAWGVNLSGSLNVSSRDSVILWFVVGQGVGGMGNDTSFVDSDAALEADGTLKALLYGSAMGALTHRWTPRWRSTVTYGYVNLENTGVNPDAYHQSHYGSVNLVYQLFKRMSIGLEGLGGYKQVQDGRSVTLYRIQLGVGVSIFD